MSSTSAAKRDRMPSYSLPDPVFPQPLIAAGTGALVGVIVAGVLVAVSARRRTRL
jgi:hypothetical protein